MKDPRHPEPPAPAEQRANALRDVLRDKGVIPEGHLESFHQIATQEWHPRNGARVVARAWVDAEFRARLLTDGTAACAELGYSGPQGEYIVALEDTPALHHVIVCTQCSCTAWPVLGLPPDWYKSLEYRARVVRESRTVLREMGMIVPPEVEIAVYDTTAETRYLVLPLRPEGTQTWSEEELASIVTREAMIGVAGVEVPSTPQPAPEILSKTQ